MVIILRGPSGAGKSTYAKKHHPDAHILSADDFFMVNGEYQFNPAKLPAAHAKCLQAFVNLVQQPDVTIVVDNTNTAVAEVAPYAALALTYGHDLNIVTFDGDYRKAAKRNVHLVPATTVYEQDKRISDQTKLFPPWWPQKTVNY